MKLFWITWKYVKIYKLDQRVHKYKQKDMKYYKSIQMIRLNNLFFKHIHNSLIALPCIRLNLILINFTKTSFMLFFQFLKDMFHYYVVFLHINFLQFCKRLR